MPVYTVTTLMGLLDLAQKEHLAAGLTAIHREETGAPDPLIHVVFFPYPKGSVWTSSQPSAPVIVSASIRTGRPEAVRERLLHRISALMRDVIDVPERDVLVCLSDIPPQWAMAAGMVAPVAEPAAEAAWVAEFDRRFPAERFS